MVLRILIAGTILFTAGCAARSEAGGTPGATQSQITAAEIRDSGTTNAYDLIQKLRPQYLRVRGRSSINQSADRVSVYMDNVELGGVEALRTIATNTIARVEYVRGPDTSARFGLDRGAGVIHVITLNRGGGA